MPSAKLMRDAPRELGDLSDNAVRNALERGEPWSRIGPALGVTPAAGGAQSCVPGE